MEIQAHQVVKRVFDLISKQKELTPEERSYIIGTLETLLAMYSDGGLPPEEPHKGIFKSIIG